jgi:plastocyanin
VHCNLRFLALRLKGGDSVIIWASGKSIRIKQIEERRNSRMKGNKLLLTMAGAVFIFTTAIFIGSPSIIEAAEKCAVVTIQSQEGISPDTLKIKKGDCVVWLNWTHGEDLKIIFKEGKRCQDNTKAPVGFKMWKGCYVTDYLDYGRTSSLVFDQAGTFKYEVEFKPGTEFKAGIQKFGTIVVE